MQRFKTYTPGELARKCWDSWARVLPDYRVMVWDESTLPDNAWMRRALEGVAAGQGKVSNIAGYARYYALAKYGGISMDNDVETIKPFDLSHEGLCAFQRDDIDDGSAVNIAVLGCEPGHPLAKELLARCEAMDPLAHPLGFGPFLITKILREWGMQGLNVEQTVRGVKVYSKEKFYPWRWDEAPDRSRITPETFAVHLWESSWTK